MSKIDHPAADIIRQLLINLSLANRHDAPQWPSFVELTPNDPDNSIGIYGAEGEQQGRVMHGETVEHYAIQIIVKGSTHDISKAKAEDIAEAFDLVLRSTVTLTDPAATYLIQSVNRKGSILSLGLDTDNTNWLHSINVTSSLWKVS